MKELINVFVIIMLGIIYLVTFTKIQQYYFNKKYVIKNNALTILMLASIIASGIILIDISTAISEVYNYFYDFNLKKGILYMSAFFLLSFIISLCLFHVTFLSVSLLTKEQEKEELIKNNIELSLIHSITLIILSFVIAPALLAFFTSFIPYPELPF